MQAAQDRTAEYAANGLDSARDRRIPWPRISACASHCSRRQDNFRERQDALTRAFTKTERRRKSETGSAFGTGALFLRDFQSACHLPLCAVPDRLHCPMLSSSTARFLLPVGAHANDEQRSARVTFSAVSLGTSSERAHRSPPQAASSRVARYSFTARLAVSSNQVPPYSTI